MRYVDGYVLPVPKKNLKAYVRMAKKAGRIWREHGALEYRECVGEDLNVKVGLPFPRLLTSRAHRDRVNAKVMKDPRIAGLCDATSMPFDAKRMAYGGFSTMVDV